MTRSVISIRVDKEVADRIRKYFYNPLTRKPHYGKMSLVGEALWRRWLDEMDQHLPPTEGEDNARD